jgi:hypothetical protein
MINNGDDASDRWDWIISSVYQINGRLLAGKRDFGRDKSIVKRLFPRAYNTTVNSFIFLSSRNQKQLSRIFILFERDDVILHQKILRI